MAEAAPDRLPAQLPERIALFPLFGALLLPRAHLPLHIFEPRYLAMVDEVLTSPHRLIGMIQPLAPNEGARLHRIGWGGAASAVSGESSALPSAPMAAWI
ncbi:Putative ATP-dependent protease La, LON [Ketogulonicigenium vulgare Y25]|uniref:LON peptidase substrate-binding domain-containing protein n=1 Tax=Ketogulonicigenium vulgare TaxID=92945 RepID=UPI0001E67978|nr:Putative ATP-dependent protease La, LON [Ketogulonicigenium vulgare Y25]